jgi:thiamine-phosphate pyrophosphorylase
MNTVAPRLYLITPAVGDGAALAPALDAALGACDIACVLLRTAAAMDATARCETVALLAGLAQRHGVACLVENDIALARLARTDGVHMAATDPALASALQALHPAHIVGVGGLTTRDAAMAAGEAGVDYLMFGGPTDAAAHAAIVERVAWWAEIFNVPCVGYAADLAGIADLVLAGADFIALCDAVFADPRGAAVALREASAVVSDVHVAA